MQRVLELEVMDSPQEADEYDAMDFTQVNTAFAQQAIALGSPDGLVLELIQHAGLPDVKVYQSSDRHWTAERAWQSC